MKQKFKIKYLINLCAVFAIVLQTMSCSNDAFFGFEDDEFAVIGEIDYSLSNEFLRLMDWKNRFDEMALCSDTTNMLFCGCLDGKLVYSSIVDSVLFKSLASSYARFANKYPICAHVKVPEKRQSLFKTVENAVGANRYSLNYHKGLKRIKSNNSECKAIRALERSSQWSSSPPNDIVWVYDNSLVLDVVASFEGITACYALAMAGNKEVGGYMFDDSAITIEDPAATETSMRFVWWNWGTDMPLYAFHCHPRVADASLLQMSDADWYTLSSLSRFGVAHMVIIARNGTIRQFYLYDPHE